MSAQFDAAAMVRQQAHKIKRRLPANIELDDLLSEGAFAAWLGQQDFDGRGDIAGFLTQRVQQRILDYVRAQSPAKRGQPAVQFVGLDEIEHLASEECPLAECAASELRASIVHAVAALPQRQQEIFLKVYLHDEQPIAVAAECGVHRSRICQLMQSAKKSLQRALLAHAADRGFAMRGTA